MPKLKDEAKVSAIYEAALKVILDTGYVGLKMSQVAQEAGIATGTIYTYFKKQEGVDQ